MNWHLCEEAIAIAAAAAIQPLWCVELSAVYTPHTYARTQPLTMRSSLTSNFPTDKRIKIMKLKSLKYHWIS